VRLPLATTIACLNAPLNRSTAAQPYPRAASRDTFVGRAGPSKICSRSPPSTSSAGPSRLIAAAARVLPHCAWENDEDEYTSIGAFLQPSPPIGQLAISSTSQPIVVEDVLDLQAATDRRIAQVCEIFTDVLPSHVAELLERVKATHPENLVDAVVQLLFEREYPKLGKDKGKAKATEPRLAEGSGSFSVANVDYISINRVIANAPSKYRPLALVRFAT
jgi:hypothetical protein